VSLDKAIEHGKEKRKPYRRAKPWTLRAETTALVHIVREIVSTNANDTLPMSGTMNTHDWPRRNQKHNTQQGVGSMPFRTIYFLHECKAGKWCVIDRRYDLADGGYFTRKSDCIKSFIKRHIPIQDGESS
jgi:hypothetical protein